ncbi:MAG TPA: ATP-binding protein, partial [Naasia sp.]
MAERIRFSASILRRLGEELNPNVDQGIIELVKNAYDADATTCLVTLAGPDEGDYVEVEDDGKGMTSADIIDGWLVLGSSNKSTGARTGKGRTPAGNKGLGRLAALRLGHEAEMRSTVLGVPSQEVVRLEWDRFDEAGIVEEVPVAIEKQPADVSRQGTTITVRRLRRAITRPEVKRLARAMILLADPFADANSGFEPKLNASDFADLARLVEMRYFEEAEYHLIARLEGGLASAEIQDWRGDTLFRGSHSDVAPDGDHRYVTVDATFELWAYSLSGASFQSRIASLSEVREWLAAFGGVHVYANGIRVAPYGNAGDDWLEMNLARVRSPEERPSTNNSIGRIRFEDPEGRLEQKTDRSGFIESEAVENLRLFGRDALEWMARVRLREAERRRTRARLEKPSQTEQGRSGVEDVITSAVPDPVAQTAVQKAFRDYNAAREREVATLRGEIQLYRTLSTAGITAAVFAHESNGNPLKVIDLSLNAL